MMRTISLWLTLVFILISTLDITNSYATAQEIRGETVMPTLRAEKMTEEEVRSFLEKQGLSETEIVQRLTGNLLEALPADSSSMPNSPTNIQVAYYTHDRNFMASCNNAKVVSYLAPGNAYIGVTNFDGTIAYWTGWFWSEGGYYSAVAPGGSYNTGRGVSTAYPYVSGVGCI